MNSSFLTQIYQKGPFPFIFFTNQRITVREGLCQILEVVNEKDLSFMVQINLCLQTLNVIVEKDPSFTTQTILSFQTLNFVVHKGPKLNGQNNPDHPTQALDQSASYHELDSKSFYLW